MFSNEFIVFSIAVAVIGYVSMIILEKSIKEDK
jgi:hypothetical protein